MKTRLLYGERIGRQAAVRLACSAAVFDPSRTRLLLTRRSDNGQWCLPGGALDPGESVAEACQRELWEETGLRVVVRKLLGVYSSPDVIIEYPDGNRFQIVALNLAAEVVGGELSTSQEVTEAGYFTAAEIEQLNVMEHHRERIADAFQNQAEAFIR